MTDWILKRTEDIETDKYNGNYLILLTGYLLERDIVQVVVNNEVKVVNIINPVETRGYEVIIVGYISNDLNSIKVVEMNDIPKVPVFISENSLIPYVYISPRNMDIKIRNNKGFKIIGYDSDDLYINLKIKDYKEYYQPLFVITDKTISEVKKLGKGKKMKKKYNLEAIQLGI